MVNRICAQWQRVESGWDPVPESHAQSFAAAASASFDEPMFGLARAYAGSLQGKRVLDLGGGPGVYSNAFAREGACVTWHDVSARYARIAAREGLPIEFSLGYMEDAERFLATPFDIVFCRGCWNYSQSDARFSRLLAGLVRPGGFGCIKLNTSEFRRRRGLRRIQELLNDRVSLKIGHPYPGPGRVPELFEKLKLRGLSVDDSHRGWEQITFSK
jgi:2-polyprenyl-3-methyl-5-hydroxy-6-metoxy-1,4-benzoquinol methylase